MRAKMEELKGKTVLVTGGGSGIGFAVARAFWGEEARVAITGRDADKLRHAADSLGRGPGVLAHAADITDFRQVQTLVDSIGAKLGPIDILVNNAGGNLKERAFREL